MVNCGLEVNNYDNNFIVKMSDNLNQLEDEEDRKDNGERV